MTFMPCRKLTWVGALALVFVFSLAPMDPATAAKKALPSFFNSKEIRSENLKPFKKWNSALGRYSKQEAAKKKGPCGSKKFNKCHYAKWMQFLKSVQGKDQLSQIKAVNGLMNRAKYITDKANWGRKDYWSTPSEFMTRFGDCEDYAIIKFMSLKKLGFKSEQLRVVAVKDMNLKVGHAVLVVFIGGKSYLLDNQIKQVVETKTVRHYRPVFSISTTSWWRHRV